MRIALCEDEKMHAAVTQDIIRQWSASREQDVEIAIYESAEAFLKDFHRGVKYDLSFLDIHLGGMSGIDLARSIRQFDMSMLIVFVTNFRDYVFEGYEVSAFRFLMKPVKERGVVEALNAASEICRRRGESYFTIVKEDAIQRIAKSGIVYFATQNHYIHVHTFDGVHVIRGKMSSLDDEFAKPMFVKCNRGIMINVEHISSIRKDQVSMVNKETLPLSRVYWEELNRCYIAVHVTPAAEKFRQSARS